MQPKTAPAALNLPTLEIMSLTNTTTSELFTICKRASRTSQKPSLADSELEALRVASPLLGLKERVFTMVDVVCKTEWLECLKGVGAPLYAAALLFDASPTGLGVILEQNGRPVICASRRLTQAAQGYSQTQREALVVYWGVGRLHKYHFGEPFTIVTDHEALKFVYHPMKSLAKSSAAMVQRWSIALSSYTYNIIHRGAKSIQAIQDGLDGTRIGPDRVLRRPLDRALPELDGVSRHQLLSDRFIESVQPALSAQLRLARATSQLGVEDLVHLAREPAEAPLATLQPQKKRDGSPLEELQTRLDQLAEQLAVVKTEPRRHAGTSRCYKCC
ncbi:hypothetical protein T265_04640 [Opisthorchis viverrini]|uniref:Reverse transcriptase RNase H-like domain-containing protein n=1 Tax=Opisthorchis viverrini TaxID=6198 RepID=A0A074ZRY9_OPIVI|nr:hypothetical protein T265_04640 [Opisthorchis viverrini]KER28597.1 hypothetical protein T265_04640 [Opisthorchis viverrini]